MAKRLESWVRRRLGHRPSARERLAILLPVLTFSVLVGLGGTISLILTGPSVWTLLIVGGGMGVLILAAILTVVAALHWNMPLFDPEAPPHAPAKGRPAPSKAASRLFCWLIAGALLLSVIDLILFIVRKEWSWLIRGTALWIALATAYGITRWLARVSQRS